MKYSNDSSVQLTISEPSIEGLFKDLLDEIKGFKYQITLKVLLSKYKEYGEREFTAVYSNSTTKRVIDSKYDLDKSFEEVFNRFDNWIYEGSGWIFESIDSEHVKISIFSPLPRSSYNELFNKLRNSKKGLINIRNNDN